MIIPDPMAASRGASMMVLIVRDMAKKINIIGIHGYAGVLYGRFISGFFFRKMITAPADIP